MIFAAPRNVLSLEDCYFYHVMEIPGVGVVHGAWDLRNEVDDYLGRVSFTGKRVLEIGPARGFLSFEMERRGARVVAVEVPDDPGWNFVPFPNAILGPIYEDRREIMRKMKNSFWFAHAAHRSKVKLYYGDAHHLPDFLGNFDIAVMAAVLLHCHSPLQIIEQCANRADTLILVDMLHPDLEGKPICRLAPSLENLQWDTWWNFSTDFFIQFLKVLGFTKFDQFKHTIPHHEDGRIQPYTLFTIVAARS